MLKIRDDIDLKVLEKYGFHTIINSYNEKYYFKKAYSNDEQDGRVYYTIYFNTNDYFTGRAIYIDCRGYSRLDNTLYDLIKDGIVEKVEQ